MRAVYRRVLVGVGHTIVEAASGEQALEEIGKGPHFDLVVLDVHMPGMGGVSAFHVLRRSCPELPVLLSSGYREAVVDSLRDSDSRLEFLAKPFSRATLLQAVTELLGVSPTPGLPEPGSASPRLPARS